MPLHHFKNTRYSGAPEGEATRAMIFVHGRGDSSDQMQYLAHQLIQDPAMAFVFPKATNSAWYPKGFMEDWQENQPWLDSALQYLDEVVKHLNKQDIANNDIFLLGFSQGACLALEYATRNAQKYAGIMALSGGLIGPYIEKKHYHNDFEGTEVFIGCSDVDHHIPVGRVHASEEVLVAMGAQVDKRIYPGMGHTINEDELEKVKEMVQNSIAG